MLEEVPEPEANDESVRKHDILGKIFDHKVPQQIDGLECKDRATMKKVWPEGTEKALQVRWPMWRSMCNMLTEDCTQVLDKFLNSAARTEDLGLVDPLQQGGTGPAAVASSTNDTIADEDEADEGEQKPKPSKGTKSKSSTDKESNPHSRIRDYADGRNSADANTSSRTSPYLTGGVMSARMVLNRAKKLGKRGKLESGRDTGVGMWVQEVAWRDFYNHVRRARSCRFLPSLADLIRRSWRPFRASAWAGPSRRNLPMSSGKRTTTSCRRGRTDGRAFRLWMLRCGSAIRMGGCTTGLGW